MYRLNSYIIFLIYFSKVAKSFKFKRKVVLHHIFLSYCWNFCIMVLIVTIIIIALRSIGGIVSRIIVNESTCRYMDMSILCTSWRWISSSSPIVNVIANILHIFTCVNVQSKNKFTISFQMIVEPH